MASGVETEKGLATALLETPVHAVLVTRELKRAPGDLFLRTGSGRAKKDTLPHHVVNACVAMIAGTPKDAVANAVAFGAMIAGKVEALSRKVVLSNDNGTPFSETVSTINLRERIGPQRQNSLSASPVPEASVEPPPALDADFPEGQSLLDAMVALLADLAKRSEVQNLSLGLNPYNPYKLDIEVWLTTRPTRRATIVHRISDKMTIRRVFTSVRPNETEPLDGFVEHGRTSFEVIGWSALVAMAHLAYARQAQNALPCSDSNPSPAEGGEGDAEPSAAKKTEAVEAPPSTASGIPGPLTDQQQAPQQLGHPVYRLSLSPREGAGTLDVSAGLWGVQSSDKQDHPSYEHADPHSASAAFA